MHCPALLIAAPASGQGKTTVTAGLARLLTRRGARVRVFKTGPDFIDAGWHALASGAPVHNLDLWMTGEADIRARLYAAAGVADVILVEGVMGLHDGRPSSADLAHRLGLQVLAVVQADAMAQTLGALVHGLRHYRADAAGPLRWAGVLANGVAGPGHAALLREALAPADGWLGHLAPDPALHLPERGLGLDGAGAQPQRHALAWLDAAADALATTLLGGLELSEWRARWSVAFEAPSPPADAPPLLAGRTLAVARDAAFDFIYPANLETLRALGAHIVFFSPLAGQALPACDAVWLPGGHPERHARALSACEALRQQIRAHADAGRPIWAEGGGLTVLLDELVDATGTRHPMWGVLPGRACMQPTLAGLGLQQWRVSADGPPLRGHCFHRTRVEAARPPHDWTMAVRDGVPARRGEAVHAGGPGGAVRGSLFHPWMASSPVAAARLFLAPPDGKDPAATAELLEVRHG